MAIIDTSESKKMRFNVNIQGVDYKQLQGSVKFRLEGVEYGFPVDIMKDHISVDVPPLDDIIKKGLVDGETVECQLDVFGEGFYMMPWTGKFELSRKVVVEAVMVYEDDFKGKKSRTPMIEVKEELTENDNKVRVEENVDNGNETSQMIKLLDELISKRLKIFEGTTLKTEDIPDSDDNLKDLNDPEVRAIRSQPNDNNDLDLNKGIMGKRGKRNIVTEPPESGGNNKKVKMLDSLVDKFISKSNMKNVTNEKRQMIENKIKNKIYKIKKTKNVTENKKPKKKRIYETKELGDTITKQDLKNLFESVGMTKVSSQQRMIDVAKKMGSEDISEIYHSIKRIVKPAKTPSSYEDFVKKATSSL